LREPRRAVDVFGSLFARAIQGDQHLLQLATGESLAHLNHPVQRGEAARESDGAVDWYRSV